MSIETTPSESSLFEVLVNAAALSERSVTVRVAGGWVRDKLLGQSSLDIDICLDTCTGERFASLVHQYLQNLEGENGEHHECSRVSVIKANPDKSKHLETATMTIDSIECDFVNLRAEVYENVDNRIPSRVEFGTPEEDAYRRDFTVNSLFYNLQSRKVEDWTNKGVNDMKLKIIRTPLDPNITFRDDPLRLLRAIRFAVRCGFVLANDLRKASTTADVRSALQKKVSRERIGKEIEGMLSGKNANPLVALRLISELNLQDLIFTFPEVHLNGKVNSLFSESDVLNMEGEVEHTSPISVTKNEGWTKALDSISLVPEVINRTITIISKLRFENASKLDERLLYIGAFLLPFGELFYTDKKGKVLSLVSYIIGNSLKYKKSDVNEISLVMKMCDSFKDVFINKRLRNIIPSRLSIGLLLRKLKSSWPLCLSLAAISDILTNENSNNHALTWKTFEELYTQIFELKLDGCWRQKPVLNGKEIAKALGIKNGPSIGFFVDQCFQFMLRHPEGSKEECIIYLKKCHEDHSTDMNTNMTQLALSTSKRSASQASL